MAALTKTINISISLQFMFAGLICFLLLFAIGCDSDNNSGSTGTIARVGPLKGIVSDHIKSLEELKPYNGGSDSPVILDHDTILMLSQSERAGLKSTYDAGFCVAILDPTNDEVGFLHQIVDSELQPGTSSNSDLLAYITCKDESVVGRAVHTPTPDMLNELEETYQTAAVIIVEDLLIPQNQSVSVSGRQEEDGTTNLATTKPAFTYLMSIPDSAGVYNSTIQGWAVYTCDKIDTGDALKCSSNPTNLDQYFITLEADWTPGSYWASGDDIRKSGKIGGLCFDDPAFYIPGKWNRGSKDDCDGKPKTYCAFNSYPRSYEVAMSAPKRAAGTIFQRNALPSSSGGKTESYTSGFRFNFGGSISASGPGLISSATWDNATTTTVPELTLEAGNFGIQGAFWVFKYDPDTIEIGEGDAKYACLGNRKNALKDPVFGQTSGAKYSNAVQTVQWFACPTREGSGFEVEVEFIAAMADSEVRVWFDKIDGCSPGGGDCSDTIIGANFCECSAMVNDYKHTATYKYTIPYPPTDCN